MKCLTYALMVSLWALMSGCRESNRELDGIRRDIARFPDLLLTTQKHPITEVEALTERICALPTREQKEECFEKWADTLFAFDLTRIPVEDSERFFRCVHLMGDFAISKMYGHRPSPFVERYELRFRHLEWLRRQIRLVAPPRTYPTGVQMIWDLSGRAHWDVRRKDYPTLKHYRKLLARYKAVQLDIARERDVAGHLARKVGDAALARHTVAFPVANRSPRIQVVDPVRPVVAVRRSPAGQAETE